MTSKASAPENPPGSPPLPSLDDTGGFLRSVGLTLDEVTGTRVHGYADLGQDHHTPWGVVRRGYRYSTAFQVDDLDVLDDLTQHA